MPSPVEALPCGSRSTISTCSPMAASAVPRLIAVVVLPTPPFWLATASTRGGLGATAKPSGVAISARSAAGASVVCVIDPNSAPPQLLPILGLNEHAAVVPGHAPSQCGPGDRFCWGRDQPPSSNI